MQKKVKILKEGVQNTFNVKEEGGKICGNIRREKDRNFQNQ